MDKSTAQRVVAHTISRRICEKACKDVFLVQGVEDFSA